MAKSKQLDETGDDLYRLLLEFKDYAVIRIATNGHIMSWNMGAKHIYGFDAEDVVGEHFSFLSPEGDIGGNDPDNLLQIAREEGRYEKERWKKRKDGTAFYANIIITALYDGYGNVTGFAHVTHDITVRKKLEDENRLLNEELEERVKQRTAELEVVNKELEAFSYSVSHDLRTPLRAVSGYSIMLKEDYEAMLDAEGNRLLDTILSNTKMMGELIDDLLAFSKMARLVVMNESIDMHELVQQCLDKLITSNRALSVSIGTLPPCKGDKSMLRQVWHNLIDNAIKYSSKKQDAEIEIGAMEQPHYNVYYIKDNGTGFDMKYAHKLFGVFQRLHRQDEFEGTGVGLALAKRIISKHGGEIWAEASLQQGATFYFSIPKNTK